jgi:hypothetical protein
MRCIHRFLIGAALIVLSAASLSAQTAGVPDSTRLTTLTTVTVTAQSGNWLTRADDLRNAVIFLTAENRRLTGELRRQDARVVVLATRLDSLQKLEAEQQAAIATIADSVASTRARRRAIEARIIAAGIRQQPQR